VNIGVNDTVARWQRCTRGPRIKEALAAFKEKMNKKNMPRQIALHYIYLSFAQKIWGLSKDHL
jgi:hypothetical protein